MIGSVEDCGAASMKPTIFVGDAGELFPGSKSLLPWRFTTIFLTLSSLSFESWTISSFSRICYSPIESRPISSSSFDCASCYASIASLISFSFYLFLSFSSIFY